MTADAATTGGLVVLGRDEVAGALYDLCDDESHILCGEGMIHADHYRVADALVARGRPVAEVVAGFAEDEALMLRWHAISNPDDPDTPTLDWGRASRKARALAAALVEQEAER